MTSQVAINLLGKSLRSLKIKPSSKKLWIWYQKRRSLSGSND